MTGTNQALRILLLGGTTEATELAARLAGDARFNATLSLAGRTIAPSASPLPTRTGGFGGADGLAKYLRDEAIDRLIDATHPFAAIMSANAIDAARRANVSLLALERPPWQPVAGDRWQTFKTVEDAVAELPRTPQRIFSGLGRLSLDALAAAPQHHYVIRVIDRIEKPKDLPNATIIAARGPFKPDDDTALFAMLDVDLVLAKNAGGPAAYAKIEAARRLGRPVYMIDRPYIPPRPTFATVEELWAALVAHHAPPAERGV